MCLKITVLPLQVLTKIKSFHTTGFDLRLMEDECDMANNRGSLALIRDGNTPLLSVRYRVVECFQEKSATALMTIVTS